jgi:hypothetical protein
MVLFAAVSSEMSSGGLSADGRDEAMEQMLG